MTIESRAAYVWDTQPSRGSKIDSPGLPPGDHFVEGLEIIGYHDLDRRPGFKMGMHVADGRWYLYLGTLWHRGWSILDVTDPAAMRLVRFIEGPPNTWTIQMQVAEGRMVTALEKIDPGWGDDPTAPYDEGFLLWDLAEPTEPRVLGRHSTGGQGTHRNFYTGGAVVHLSSVPPGFQGHVYESVEISQPDRPQRVGRWWLPGQWLAGGESGLPGGTSLHAPFVADTYAFLAYGAAGLIILDLADPSEPHLVSQLPLAPPFNPVIAAHTAVPLLDRGLVILNSEAIEEGCAEPLCFAGLVDVSDLRAPRVVSMFPVPGPPQGAHYRNFCEHGGRFGPHNVHQGQGNPVLLQPTDLVFLTYFNAGLRVYEIRDPRLPVEVAFFLPPDPVERRGVLPSTLVAQTEDVLVDARGFIYVTDKNHGLYALRLAG